MKIVSAVSGGDASISVRLRFNKKAINCVIPIPDIIVNPVKLKKPRTEKTSHKTGEESLPHTRENLANINTCNSYPSTNGDAWVNKIGDLKVSATCCKYSCGQMVFFIGNMLKITCIVSREKRN